VHSHGKISKKKAHPESPTGSRKLHRTLVHKESVKRTVNAIRSQASYKLMVFLCLVSPRECFSVFNPCMFQFLAAYVCARNLVLCRTQGLLLDSMYCEILPP
jgi:hypothetical protein